MPTLTWVVLPFQNRFCLICNIKMCNYDHLAIFRIYIIQVFYNSIRFFLILCFCIFFAGKIYAQKTDSFESREMEKLHLNSRIAATEPEFFVSGTSTRWQGFYFGVGFRKVRLKVADDVIISDRDGEANGIGVNLGYFWEEQVLEYERQISIVEHSKPFSHENKSGQKLEVVQNNFWYALYPKISRNFYLHYGTGIQFTKVRFAASGSNKSFVDEIALGIEAGVSYFVTTNFMLYYRFSVGQQIHFLSATDSGPFLKQSQLHTFYLNYFFPL